MSIDQRMEIFNACLSAGTCKRCALRYTGETCVDFEEPEDYITKLGLHNINGMNDLFNKKRKTNPCIVCLDVLQDSTIEDMINCDELKKIAEYDADTFVIYISLPTSALIREHSMEIYMRKKFPDHYKELHSTPINKVWRLSSQNKIGKSISKKYSKNGLILIQFTTSYEFDEEEAHVMYQLEEKFKKIGKTKMLSRNFIAETLKAIDDELFGKHSAIPPDSPNSGVKLTEVSFQHEPIYIAGRYCKYSRCLGQTPWVVDGKRMTESSVQEILFKGIGNSFNSNNLIFSSSGREDYDVRMLGRGRPFYIKVFDPKKTKIEPEIFRKIEKNVNRSQMISVRDLQLIDKNLLSNIKDGEQSKRKTYRALCILSDPENLDKHIQKINEKVSVSLEQTTPIRVLHRRSFDVRKREIYKMSACHVDGKENLFQLDMVTQAGTYVKEFVHSDLGRTTPSLKDIIGVDVDILTLDVMDIDLDFPPAIN